MSILLIVSLVGVAILIAMYLVSNANTEPDPEETEKGEYQAVAIAFNRSSACPAVMRYAGQPFLCADAPKLPLADCT